MTQEPALKRGIEFMFRVEGHVDPFMVLIPVPDPVLTSDHQVAQDETLKIATSYVTQQFPGVGHEVTSVTLRSVEGLTT